MKTFADSHTRDFYVTGRSRRFPCFRFVDGDAYQVEIADYH